MANHPEPIVMLTHNDVTVSNAIEIFLSVKDISVKYWGIKEKGLAKSDMKKLCSEIKKNGKVPVLEAVTYTEESSVAAAYTAVECGFEILMGTLYNNRVNEILKENNIKYMPFAGKVYGRPSVLEGDIPQIIAEAQNCVEKGVWGFDLLGYRYKGDAVKLINEFVGSIPLPVCVAGSISSIQRLDEIKNASPWAFTVGSALFENKFGDTIKEQIEIIKARAKS